MASGSTKLYGRETAFAALDAAWSDPTVRILSVIGPGGTGKSTLLRRWARARLDDATSGGAPFTAFAWQFGDPSDTGAASDTIEQFIPALERWLGLPVQESVDARTRLRRASARAGRAAALLVLDGIDAIHPRSGIAVESLLVWLRSGVGRTGLCVVSSRTSLPILYGDEGHREIRLGGLEVSAAVRLLRGLGLSGRRRDFEAAVAEVDGHPLALELVGRYVKHWEDGDIRRRDRLELGAALGDYAEHIAQLVSAYEARLSAVDREVLETIALFERDVDEGTLAAILQDGDSRGLPAELSRAQRRALAKTQDLGLLSRSRGDRLRLHPLVRAHLRQRARLARPAHWQQRHRAITLHQLQRACRSGAGSTPRPQRALVAAIRHACEAGWAAGALQIYSRCLSGGAHPVSDEQEALSLSLKALLPFFDAEGLPDSSLTASEQAQVAGKLGFRLQALGRLTEAIAPMRLSAQTRMRLGEWQGAANSAGNLSSLMLTLGRIPEAIEWGRHAVACADKGQDGRQRVSKRAIQAEALHRRGELDAALRQFEEAEAIQRARKTGRPRLGSVMSYRFGALLAHLGRYDEVERRANEDLQWSCERKYVLAEALDHVLIALCRRAEGNTDQAEDALERGVALLTASGRLDHQPRGLIARAALRSETADFDGARRDLEGAAEIARLGRMRLFQIDIRVRQLRLCTLQGHPPRAGSIDELRHDIEEVGYACAYGDLLRVLGSA